MFSFENVGFSKTLNETGVKYLCCADCELGPLGYHDTTNNDTKEYLIAVDRVSYYRNFNDNKNIHNIHSEEEDDDENIGEDR